MSALLNTIPGDIPGLLRKWPPVLVMIDSDKAPVRGVVIDPTIEPDEPDLRCLVWNERNGRDNKAAMFVRLDLTDATGRAHAAWWVRERFNPTRSIQEEDALSLAETALEFNTFQIGTLRSLVLRLAGRTP